MKPTLTEDFTLEELKYVLTQPELWIAAGGYGRDPKDHEDVFKALYKDPDAKIFLDFQEKEPVGFFVFKRRDHATWQGHVGYLETYRGARALAAGRVALEKVFADGVQRVVAAIPDNNEPAAEFVRRLGFIHEGHTPNAVKRGMDVVGLHYFVRLRDG